MFSRNPDTFIPERWIRNSAEYQQVDRYSSLPFGHGPRACIGQRFARLENFMVAFKLVQRYRLEYHHPPVDIDYQRFGRPDTDTKIRFLTRN